MNRMKKKIKKTVPIRDILTHKISESSIKKTKVVILYILTDLPIHC